MIVTNREQLSIPCEAVSKQDGLAIASDLTYHMILQEERIVGLAANQIGVLKRVFILLIDGKYQAFINPVIHAASEPISFEGEGCLSFPGESVTTRRSNRIEVSDLLQPDRQELTGLWAVAFQHELDHLDGITFHSRL